MFAGVPGVEVGGSARVGLAHLGMLARAPGGERGSSAKILGGRPPEKGSAPGRWRLLLPTPKPSGGARDVTWGRDLGQEQQGAPGRCGSGPKGPRKGAGVGDAPRSRARVGSIAATQSRVSRLKQTRLCCSPARPPCPVSGRAAGRLASPGVCRAPRAPLLPKIWCPLLPARGDAEGWKVVSLPARGQSSPDPTQPAYSEPRCSGFGNEGSSGRGSCASPGSRNSGGGGVLLLAGLSRCPLRLQAVVTPAHPRLPLQRVLSGLWMPPSSVPEGFSGKCCRKPLQIRIARTFQGPNRFWLRIRPLRR